MRAARATATISYDPNCRPEAMGPPQDARARIEECIGAADVVKASEEDVDWLYGGSGAYLPEVMHRWGQLGAELIVITQGGGEVIARLSRTGELVTIPVPQASVVDTVGAGDSFMAGLLSGLWDADLIGSARARQRLGSAQERDVLPALQRAIAAATWTVSRAGAAAPSRDHLRG